MRCKKKNRLPIHERIPVYSSSCFDHWPEQVTMPVSNHILWLPFICSLTRLQALVESCGGILLQSNANAGKGGNYYYYVVPG